MGRVFVTSLEGSTYKCKHCLTQLALIGHVLSMSFQCKHGKAFLVDKVVNISEGPAEERLMITGMHNVVDVFCVGCGSIVGWKYLYAHLMSQKYKEGKFVLEKVKLLGDLADLDDALAVQSSDDDDA